MRRGGDLALAERLLRSTAGTGPFGFAVVAAAEAGGLVHEWRTLAAGSAGDNPFFHPDFALAAIRHVGGGAVDIATVRDAEGALVALAPFVHSRLGRVAPAVRLWSHDYGPLGTPLVAAHAVGAAIAALVEGLAPASSGRSLVVPDLAGDGPVAGALRRLAGTEGRPLAVLDDHGRAVLMRGEAGDLRANLPARRRKELGRQMRRLADAGAVRVESATEPGRIGAALEEFLVLEARGWKGKRGTALLANPATAAFARAAVANRAADGGARIDAIRVDGRPIAMLVSFVSGATACTWKIAYDEAEARFSPGAQLMLEAPANLFADPAVAVIDSCASADHPMIDRLWPGRMPVGTFVLGPPGGSVLHRIGIAAARAEIVARANVRQLRDRLG